MTVPLNWSWSAALRGRNGSLLVCFKYQLMSHCYTNASLKPFKVQLIIMILMSSTDGHFKLKCLWQIHSRSKRETTRAVKDGTGSKMSEFWVQTLNGIRELAQYTEPSSYLPDFGPVSNQDKKPMVVLLSGLTRAKKLQCLIINWVLFIVNLMSNNWTKTVRLMRGGLFVEVIFSFHSFIAKSVWSIGASIDGLVVFTELILSRWWICVDSCC